MEEWSVRIIFISVSVFIIMGVISAMTIYYGKAIDVAEQVGHRTDIASEYDEIMKKEDLDATTLTGVDVRSLITKYITDDSVSIRFNGTTLGGSWRYSTGNIKEEMLDKINPIWNYTVTKEGEILYISSPDKIIDY